MLFSMATLCTHVREEAARIHKKTPRQMYSSFLQKEKMGAFNVLAVRRN